MSPLRCSRPTCAGEAAAWLAYDYEARCAWLEDEPVPAGSVLHRWPLCEEHANGLRVPRGWFSVDRRASGNRPEAPPPLTQVAEAGPPARSRGLGPGAPARGLDGGAPSIPLDDICFGPALLSPVPSRPGRDAQSGPAERLTGIL